MDLVICADHQHFAVFQSVKGHGSNGRIGAAVIGLVDHGHAGDGQYRRGDVPFLGYRPGVVAGAGDRDRCLAHIGVRTVGNGVIRALCQRLIAIHRSNRRLDRQPGIGLVGEIADRDLGQRLLCDGEHISLVLVRAVLPNGVVLVLQLDSHILAACVRPLHSVRYSIVGRIGEIAQNIGLLLTRVFKLRGICGRDGDLTLADGELGRAGVDLDGSLILHLHGVIARVGGNGCAEIAAALSGIGDRCRHALRYSVSRLVCALAVGPAGHADGKILRLLGNHLDGHRQRDTAIVRTLDPDNDRSDRARKRCCGGFLDRNSQFAVGRDAQLARLEVVG